MKTVLFVSQSLGENAACGIGLMGKLMGETLVHHPTYNFIHVYADDIATVHAAIDQHRAAAVIYNFHPIPTHWMRDPVLQSARPDVVHILLYHDMNQQIADEFESNNTGWRYMITDDPTINENTKVFTTNRLLPGQPTVEYVEQERPIIGYQGFAIPHKNIPRIAQVVNEEFDEAILRLHIPFAYYADQNGQRAMEAVAAVKSIITKPKIDLVVTHDLMSTQDVINMMAMNTVNCYFFDYQNGWGVSSSTDYALACGRPIATTKSFMLRNFWNLSPSVNIEDNSLRQIIANGTAPLEPLYKAYSRSSVFDDYTRILDQIV